MLNKYTLMKDGLSGGLHMNSEEFKGRSKADRKRKTKAEKTIALQSSIQSQVDTDGEASSDKRDIILRTKYSGILQSAAENFIVGLFEKIGAMNSLEGVNLEVPVTAAMAIITNTSWHQPSESQMEYDFTRECIDRGLITPKLEGDDSTISGNDLELLLGQLVNPNTPSE